MAEKEDDSLKVCSINFDFEKFHQELRCNEIYALALLATLKSRITSAQGEGWILKVATTAKCVKLSKKEREQEQKLG